MNRWMQLAVSAITAGAIVAGASAVQPRAAEAPRPAFKRGATLVELFQFPATVGDGASKSYAVPAYPHVAAALASFDFDGLRRIGFDHMRVPLDIGPLLQGTESERHTILDDLVTAVTAINRHGLNVLVTLFPPSLQHELPQTYLDGLDGPKFRAYAAMVEKVAATLAPLDEGVVALEAMNEPQSQCRIHFGTDWTAYQENFVGRIRRIAPELPLFLTGGCWSNIEGIVLLDTDLLRDRRNFVSVHFYYPFLFTHQGATWTMPYLAGTIGVPFPASAGSLEDTLELTRARFAAAALAPGVDRLAAQARAETEIRRYFREAQGTAQLEEWMKQVADWQLRQQVDSDRIVFTEFGAMRQEIEHVEIDRASRARWLRETSMAIENRGWGWTAYVLRDGPFGLYARQTDRDPDPQLLRALRLNVPDDVTTDRRAGR
jgi:endoglucanase